MNKKHIIIIGATSGIGRALFEKYAAEGNRIGIVGRRTHLLDELRQEHPDTTVVATAHNALSPLFAYLTGKQDSI
jgi:short-subunit dehydrogenase